MNRRRLGLLLLLLMIAAAGTAIADEYPVGGMVPREAPEKPAVTEQGFFGKLLRKLRSASVLSGPAECETGMEYTWELADHSATADSNWYVLSVGVLDGTYASPTTYDMQYIPARSQEGTTLSYTFYIPGNYIVYADVYETEDAEEILFTEYLEIFVTDSGENDMTRVVREVVAEKKTDDDFGTVLSLHDWIIDNCEFDQNKVFYSADALLLHGTGVCNSYVRAFALLLEEAGIPCRRVAGYTSGNPKSKHAWIAVEIEDQWYLIDPTWDDREGEYLRHLYFAVSSSLISINHTPQHYTGADFWPECSSLDNNWFVHGDRWREYAADLYADYLDRMETGWHRFSLEAPATSTDSRYERTMIGTVIAYAMSRTEWTYAEGRTCTGTFFYNDESRKIMGKHIMAGILELPFGLTRIEEGSFQNIGANMIVIWDNCEYIGPGAFSGMEVWEIACGSNNVQIDPAAFDDLPFVYVIANPDSSIASYAEERGWVVGDGND